jgi:spore coat polysaccharide biosynthesis protein SpsF (cytidylyltransferase family)/RimJ/RimL family protein N-acetyltransferase
VPADRLPVWRWRNDPETRRASFHQAEVPPEEHSRWFEESLARPDRRIYIVQADGVDAGVVRLDVKNGEATVNINVAPEWRGQGIGTRALRALSREAFGPLALNQLSARVKADNTASRRAFERAGFRPVDEGDPLTFVRPPRLRVVGAIQARMGSKRLPGKVLRPLAGRPMIAWLVERLRACQELETVVIATSVEVRDDSIATCAGEAGVPCIRGSETDLVTRLLQTAVRTGADALVRTTADCPFVDPAVIDGLVRGWWEDDGGADLVVNNDPPSYPHGLDAEVLPLATLKRFDTEIADPYYREWFPFWWREHRDRVRVLNIPCERDLSHHRWTVDYAEDLAFADRVFSALVPVAGPAFSLREVLEFLDTHPEVAEINAMHVHGRR